MDMRMERERRGQPETAAATTHVLAPSSPPPPPSSTSSPSHEFSFTISLHPFSNSSTTPSSTTLKHCNKSSSAIDIDLAPADDIFFHGHLLPLHLLSRPTISPRPSDISIHDLTLPLNPNDAALPPTQSTKERNKTKSLSSFFGFKKVREDRDDKKTKKGLVDIAGLLKKYAAMVLFFKGKKEKDDLRRRPYSFSGNLSNPRWRAPRRMSSGGGFSVPASKRTSPTNSGLLFASPTTAVSSSSEGSTMEELQNAIQAAIAHCKSSTGAKEDKCKF